MIRTRANVQGQNPEQHQIVKYRLLSYGFSKCNTDLTLSKGGTGVNRTKYISKYFFQQALALSGPACEKLFCDLFLNVCQLYLSNSLLVFP